MGKCFYIEIIRFVVKANIKPRNIGISARAIAQHIGIGKRNVRSSLQCLVKHQYIIVSQKLRFVSFLFLLSFYLLQSHTWVRRLH